MTITGLAKNGPLAYWAGGRQGSMIWQSSFRWLCDCMKTETGNEMSPQGYEQITHVRPRQQRHHALGTGSRLIFDKVTFSYKLRIFSVKF